MKFQIDRKRLIEAATIASKSAGQKGVKPILANVLITAKDDTIQFVGTDLEGMIMLSVPADVEKEGATTVSAKLFVEMCAGLPSDSLFPVEVESTDSQLVIGCDKVKFQLLTMDADDFPPVPVIDADYAEINASELADAMKKAAIAASDDTGNPVQRSVVFDFAELPRVNATDSRRLVSAGLPVGFDLPESLKKMYIVPKKSAIEAAAMMAGVAKAKLGEFKEQLVFQVDDVTFITRLVDGRFPDIDRVIPKESDKQVKLNRKKMLQSLKTLLPIARNNDNFVAMKFGADDVELSSFSKEQGSVETSMKPEEYTGEPIEIAFNLKYMQDFLSSVDDDNVVLKMTTPVYPGLFEAENVCYVVMPITLIKREG